MSRQPRRRMFAPDASGSSTGSAARSSSHDNAEAGSVPSWASVALPEKLITSPTFQVVPAAGCVDDRCRGGVPDRDRDRVGVRRSMAVGHPQRCGVTAGRRVRVCRLSRR